MIAISAPMVRRMLAQAGLPETEAQRIEASLNPVASYDGRALFSPAHVTKAIRRGARA